MAGDARARRGLEALLDVVVYAPIGAFFHGPEVIDELADKGRSQVSNARVIGKMAVEKGRTEAAKASEVVRDQLGDLLTAVARAAGAPMAGADAEAAPEPADDRPEPADDRPEPADDPAAAQPADDGGPALRVVTDSSPRVDELPIPDYDNLSASQVVPRLDSLASDELAAVREYERAHRGRMTILSRIAQLEAS